METNTPTFKQHYNQNTGNVPFATRAKLASAVLSKLQTAFGFNLSKLQPPTQPFGEITDQLRQMGLEVLDGLNGSDFDKQSVAQAIENAPEGMDIVLQLSMISNLS